MDTLLQDATAGEPISGLKWTHKALRKVGQALGKHSPLRAPTLSRVLRLTGYSLRVNRKRVAGRQSRGRDEQFPYIARLRQRFLKRQKRPVISVDTKKKDLIGHLRHAGRAWRREPRDVNMDDFPTQALGRALPYGVYDVGRNRGSVSVGISHDTPEFAVASLRAWWAAVGCKAYRGHTHLLSTADCGGSNGNRSLRWKTSLQQFADESGLAITVTHSPTGASKWNPIEHRMFSLISANWAGHPLDSYETLLNHIRTTCSSTGFRCHARLDTRSYATRLRVPPEEVARLRVRPHNLFPHWNYTISPHPPR